MRRALALVAVIAIVCIVLLMLMLRKLEAYRSPTGAPPPATAPRPDTGPAPEAPAPGGAGLVVFSDGSPAAGATVSSGPAGAAAGDLDGTAVGPGGSYSLPAGAAGSVLTARYGPLETRAPQPDDPGAPLPTLRLPATFRLAGRVQSRAGAAVEGAVVTCAGVRTRSGPRGAFALENVPATALRDAPPAVTVDADGHARLVWELPRDRLPPYYEDLTLLLVPAR